MFDMKDLKKLKNMDKDDLLEMVGLQRQSSADWMGPALGAFGLGILIGAGLGLMLAPKAGPELREDLRQRLQGVTDQASQTISKGASSVEKNTPRSS